MNPFKQIAQSLHAMQTCTPEFKAKHEIIIQNVLETLPHGSGIDSDWGLSEKSNPNKIILYNSYHCMNENGMYDGWIDFTVTVTPSLIHDYDIKVTGNFSQRNYKYSDIKDYLAQIMYEVE